MTIKEKALYNLINGEIWRIQQELRRDLQRELDILNEQIKYHSDSECTQKYANIAERLEKIATNDPEELYDINYEKIAYGKKEKI